MPGEIPTPAGRPAPYRPSAAVEGSRLTFWEARTDITANYTKETWRRSQSVVDLIQNHLDAQDAHWERKFLELFHINPQTSPDVFGEDQIAEIISYGHLLRRYRDTPTAHKAYEKLQGIFGEICPAEGELYKKFETEEFRDIPVLQLKVRKKDGNEYKTATVDYANIKSAKWREWEVFGFLVVDTGSGYDREFLTGVGDSTKSENIFRRGGFGEGLKVSAVNLLREGATVHLWSHHSRGHWFADAKLGEETAEESAKLMFRGLEQDHLPFKTNSFTGVDFSASPQLGEFQQILDPRLGEGIGKYILSFAEPEKVRPINTRQLQAQRVYVLDLLVAERPDLLFAYNILDKYAIKGRDRKELDESILQMAVKSSLQHMSDKEQVKTLLSVIKAPDEGTKTLLEPKMLTQDLEISDEQKAVWKKAVREAFQFDPKRTVFAPALLDPSDIRFAEQRKYRIITIPMEYVGSLDFFKGLFADEGEGTYPITLAELKKDSHYERGKPLEEETRKGIESTVALFKSWLYMELARNPRLAFSVSEEGLRHLDNLKISPTREQADIDFYRGKQEISYSGYTNELRITSGDPMKLDLEAQVQILTKCIQAVSLSPDGEGKFIPDLETQVILNELMGGAIIDGNLVLREASLPQLVDTAQIDGLSYYTQKQTDVQVQEAASLIHQTQLLSVTKESLEQTLAHLQTAVNPEDWQAFARIYKGYYYHFGGKIYQVDSQTLKLQEVKRIERDRPNSGDPEIFGTNTIAFRNIMRDEPQSITLLSENQEVYTLTAFSDTFIPLNISDGESRVISIMNPSQEVKEVYVTRKGESFHIVDADGTMHGIGSEISLDASMFGGVGRMSFFGNVMYFEPKSSTYALTITKPVEKAPPQKIESHRGESEILTEISTRYGENVWDNPVRAILDAVQNGKDAAKGQMPEISCLVALHEGGKEVVRRISYVDLAKPEYKQATIIGVDMADEGDGFTTKYLTDLGATTKTKVDIGHFGEGLKLLILSGVRQDIHIEIGSRDWIATPGKYGKAKRVEELGTDKMFYYLKYDLAWKTQEALRLEQEAARQQKTGSYIRFYAINGLDFTRIKPGDAIELTEDQKFDLQKLHALRAAGQAKTWFDWARVIDPRQQDAKEGKVGLHRYLLFGNDEHQYTQGTVTVLFDRPEKVFERGLIVTLPEEEQKKKAHSGLIELLPSTNSQQKTVASYMTNGLQNEAKSTTDAVRASLNKEEDQTAAPALYRVDRLLFGYNIDGRIITTRERNAYDARLLRSHLSVFFKDLQDIDVMKQFMSKVKSEGVYGDFVEFEILNNVKEDLSPVQQAMWRQAYYETFGEDAVLSLQAIDNELLNQGNIGGQYEIHTRKVLYKNLNDDDDNVTETERDRVREATNHEAHIETKNLVKFGLSLTRFLNNLVYTSYDDYSKPNFVPDFPMPVEQKEQIFSFVRDTGEMIIEGLLAMRQDPRKQAFLNHLFVLGDHDTEKASSAIDKKIAQFRGMTIDDMHIKPRNFPALGQFRDKQENGFELYLNTAIFRSNYNAAVTVAHELAHFFSGRGDYIDSFQQWLMLFALFGIQKGQAAN